MAFKSYKSKYMSTLDYISHQQQYGNVAGEKELLNKRFKFGKKMYRKDLYAHYGCVNAIEFSSDGQWMISGGDDKRVLMWSMNKTLTSLSGSYEPATMKSEHNSNIFCLAFNQSQTKLFSAGNDEQVILHDIKTRESLDVFLHHEAVYGLSADPKNDSLFATSCDDGRVMLWDIRQSTADPIVLANSSSAYHAVMHNPVDSRFLATANAKLGVCLHDVRKPKTNLIKYGTSLLSTSAMSVRFNSMGSQIVALRRRLPPVLYNTISPKEVAEFDNPEYYNSCTMKSCCFAGDQDQYVLSGSDDFKLYMWKIPDTCSENDVKVVRTQYVLRGHRSIVNQVRYNNIYGVIASSGVEKIIKLWSSYPFSYSDESDHEELRKVYSHEEYINLVLHSGQFMTHDYSHCSTREDPRMMAFFDSLVQRDIEGWTSDSNEAIDEKINDQLCYTVQSSGSATTTSSPTSSDDDADNNLRDNNTARRAKMNNARIHPDSKVSAIDQALHTADDAVVEQETNSLNLSRNSDVLENSPVRSRENNSSRVSNNEQRTSAARSIFARFEEIRRNSEEITNRILQQNNATILSARLQAAAGYLLSNGQRATNSTENEDRNLNDHRISRRSPEYDGDSCSDRISKLIAQKRRIHQMKLARKTMKVEYSLVRRNFSKPKGSSDEKLSDSAQGHAVGFIPLKVESENSSDTSHKDKRKLLRKRRAKLNKAPNLDSNSSDSSDEASTSLRSVNNLSNSMLDSNENSTSKHEPDSVGVTNSLFRHCKNFKKVLNLTKEKTGSSQVQANSNTLINESLNENNSDVLNYKDTEPSCSAENNKIAYEDGSLSNVQESSVANGTISSNDVNCASENNISERKNLDDNSSHISMVGPSNSNFIEVENHLQNGNSNSAFSFVNKVNKINRNYRKRKAEDD